jgi:hypothetical protein
MVPIEIFRAHVELIRWRPFALRPDKGQPDGQPYPFLGIRAADCADGSRIIPPILLYHSGRSYRKRGHINRNVRGSHFGRREGDAGNRPNSVASASPIRYRLEGGAMSRTTYARSIAANHGTES